MFLGNGRNETETKVNQWLESQPSIRVQQVLQYIYCDMNDIPWITLTVVYKTLKDALV